MENILIDYGWCQVLKRNDKYFIRYDNGGIAVSITEKEISKEKADKAIISQTDAEEVITDLQKRSL